MDLFSIIIPIYNVAPYLEDCVESAVNQTYSNIEIILVDDGSTDESGKICDKWAERDKRVKVIHQVNGGLSAARNAGLSSAKGKYIYFLDGDDYIDDELIETVATAFEEEEDIDLVVFQYWKVYSDHIDEAPRFAPRKTKVDTEMERFRFIVNDFWQHRIGWEAWNRAFKKSILDKNNIFFADNRKIFAEDLFFSLCYCPFVKKINVLSDHLYYYRQREDSIMGEQKHRLNAGRMTELGKELLDFYQKHAQCSLLAEHFSVLYYLIIRSVMDGYQRRYGDSVRNMRHELLRDVSDYSFLKKNFRYLSKEKEILRSLYDWVSVERIITQTKFYADGNPVLYVLRREGIDFIEKVVRKTKKIKNQWKRKCQLRQFEQYNKRIFFIGGEDFGNIGDYAIGKTIKNYLNKFFSEYEVLSVSARNYRDYLPLLKKYVRQSDLLILTGGGNFGSEYDFPQRIKEEVCTTWRENVKIIFPQTIFFDETETGREKLESAKAVFDKDNKVLLFTRDETSYEFAKSNFGSKAILVPDIVLYNDMIKYENQRRDKVIICLRTDVEKTLTEKEQRVLVNALKKCEYQIEFTDLELYYHLDVCEHDRMIDDRLRLFSTAKLVITDRLHGMIFSAITGTPCIAFSNYNHKIRDSYKWISYLPYIRYADSVQQALELVPELQNEQGGIYDNAPLSHFFETMPKEIKKMVEIKG